MLPSIGEAVLPRFQNLDRLYNSGEYEEPIINIKHEDVQLQFQSRGMKGR